MDGNSEQLQVINLKQLPIIEERLRDVKAKIEQRTSAVMALAVTEETRTDVKKIRTEVRKEWEGYEAQRMAVKKAIMTPYEQFEAVYKECVSNPYKAADEALGKKIADVEVGIKQQKEDDVRAFFNELTSGFGLDWLKFEQMNLKVTLTCTPKAMKTAITQSVTKIVRDCAALEENPDRDEIMVEYQKSLDLGSACQIVQQRHKQLEAQRRAAEERRARQQAQQEAEAKAKAAIEAEAAKRAVEQPAPPHEVATPPQAESPAQAPAAAPAPAAARAEKKYLAKFAVTGTLPQLKALKAFMEKEGMQYDTISYRLRLNYLKEYGFPKKAAETVALAACRMMILNPDALGDMDEDTIEAVYGDGIYNDEHDLDTAVLMENAQVNPMKMLMVLLFALTEPVNHRVHDTEWLGGFYKCIKDDASVYPGIYSALDGIGYEISDMEKSLLDGTHPSYESAEEES